MDSIDLMVYEHKNVKGMLRKNPSEKPLEKLEEKYNLLNLNRKS